MSVLIAVGVLAAYVASIYLTIIGYFCQAHEGMGMYGAVQVK